MDHLLRSCVAQFTHDNTSPNHLLLRQFVQLLLHSAFTEKVSRPWVDMGTSGRVEEGEGCEDKLDGRYLIG
jgi:hypothetical protein